MMDQNSSFHVINSLKDLELMKDDEMYKVFSYDISIIKMLYTINEKQNFEIFLQSSEFQQIKTKFYDFVKNIKDEENGDLLWIMNFLKNFLNKRPKLMSIFPSLIEIISQVYHINISEDILRFRYSNSTILLIERLDFHNQNNSQPNLNLFSLFSEKELMENRQKYFQNIIFNDDIDKFIDFALKYPKEINEQPSRSKLFYYDSDTFLLVFSLKPSISNGVFMCCIYGSIKCFKYYLINGYDISCNSNRVARCAIIGGNYEIIQIVNQNIHINFGHYIDESIKFHRYSITDWLILNYPSDVFTQDYIYYFLRKILELCFECNNYEVLLFYYFNYKSQNTNISFENFIILNSIKTRSLHYIKYFISHGFNINSKISQGQSLLHIACENNVLYIIDYLISQRCNINIKNDQNKTPFFYALTEGKIDIAEHLFSKGCNIYDIPFIPSTEDYFWDPNLTIIDFLLEHGYNINSKFSEGKIFLHFAAMDSDKSLLEYLISHGANINAKDDHGMTPIYYAYRNGRKSNFLYLFSQGCEIVVLEKSEQTNLLFNAIEWDEIDLLNELISKGYDLNEKNEKGLSPSHYAIKKGKIELIPLLILNGADIDSKDDNGQTPLIYACIFNQISVIEILISVECNIFEKNNQGIDALHYSSKYGCLDIAELLIKEGFDINTKDNYGKTPLMYACQFNQLQIIQFLISKGCDQNLSDNQGKTALHYACHKSHRKKSETLTKQRTKILEYLLTHGCDINSTDVHGQTPLHYAVKNKNINFVKYLISKDCNKEIIEKNGRTPLHYACLIRNIPVVKYLIENHCDQNIKDIYDKTPLDYANDKNISLE